MMEWMGTEAGRIGYEEMILDIERLLQTTAQACDCHRKKIYCDAGRKGGVCFVWKGEGGHTFFQRHKTIQNIYIDEIE